MKPLQRSQETIVATDAGRARVAPAPIDEVLEALAEGDLARALDAIERAGGPAAFEDDERPRLEALYAERSEGASRVEAPAIWRAIASDIERVPDERAGAARALLGRQVSALGLALRPRSDTGPVVLDLAPRAQPSLRGAPIVRGFLQDIFATQPWQPRVDVLTAMIAPHATPGVYAMQRRALAGGTPDTTLGLDEIMERLGAGRPLEEGLRHRLEVELAASGRAIELGALRIHDGAEADALCRELEAEAFAIGSDLVFRDGAFEPHTSRGLHLLVHELTHVWQQAHGEVAPGIDRSPALEAEAEQLADRVAHDGGAPARAALSPEVDGLLAGFEVSDQAPAVAPEGEAVQLCAPREMIKRKNPPRGKKEIKTWPTPDPIKPDEPKPTGECESCPEPDLEHKTFQPLRPLPDKKPEPGQKVAELSLAGHKIKVEVPEGQADGEVEIVFKDNPSPFAALVFKKAKLRFDSELRVLDGEISCAVALGNYIQVANTTLRVFEDGRVGADIRGIQINVADNLRATVDLAISPEGVWGMCTATADKLFVSDLVTVKDGLVHVRVDKSGAVSAHGKVTIQIHGLGEATLEACYVDGKWGGSITIGRKEDLTLAPGVVLEEIELTGCFAPDEWWVKGKAKVRLFDKFHVKAEAKYHWKKGAEGKWSFEGWLDQIEPVELGADMSLQKVEAHAKYEEGVWEPLTFHAELHHPWVLGTLDGTWKIEENLWSGFGRVELTKQLPMGDSGITLDQAEVTAYVVDNELTEIHGKAAATFPFQGQPTFELSCKDAVYKVKEKALWATGDLRSIRDIIFGTQAGFHAVIHKGAGVTAIVEESELKKTQGGIAFDARHQDKLLGDGGLWFNWVPGGGVNAGGQFDLRERFGLPDYTNGPLYLLPQPGHFEFLIENSEPKFIEAKGIGFEVAQGGAEGGAGLIGGQVSGRFDFDTNLAELHGNARVVRSWTEPLGDFGSVTFIESESDNLAVDITRSELTRAEGHLDVQLDVNESEHVRAFTLLGHVDGRYDPKTGKVSGKVGAELKTDLDVSLGDSGDRVVIKEGSWFTTTMTDNQLDVFEMQLVVQYIRRGELFLEGACKEALFDFKTGELDFLGSLTLKQDIEKRLGESAYSIALVKDVTNLEVEVRKNQLIRIGGDVAVQLREGGEPLLEGSLLNADYRVEEGLFSGDLELSLKRDLVWPKGADDGAALPPTLQVELTRGSRVHGRIQDNVFDQAGVELTGKVHYKGREQAEAHLDGTWNLVDDRFDLDGYFRLTNDLVLGTEAPAGETDLSAWALVFVKDSEVTIGVVANRFQPVGVDVEMQLRRAGEACAKGSVTGEYVFGDAAGFNGRIHVEVIKEIGLGRAGRFDIALSEETVGDGEIAHNALTSATLTLVLLAKEGAKPKARLGLDVNYTGGDEFSGQADFTVLDAMRLGERRMGSAMYAVDLNTKTRAKIGLEKNLLTKFSGAVGIDVSRDQAPFAEGDFRLDYDFSSPDARVTADGRLRLIGALELGTVGKYTFTLDGGSEIEGRIEDGGLAWIKGQMKLGVATAKEGRFAQLDIEGRYEGGTKPKFDGSAEATILKEHDLGSVGSYAFLLQPSSGFRIVLADSAFTEMHGDIGLIARQQSKKKDGMNGDVSMTLSGDAVKQGEKWKIDGHATATVGGSIKVGTAGDYVFWVQGGSGIDIQVVDSRLVSVEGTLNGSVTEKGKGFLGFDCWVRYEASENPGEPGWIDARGGCKLLGEKELYRKRGFAFSLMPTQGYTAFIVVERNAVKEVGGTLAFRLENTNAKPQPLKVVGSATGHYDNTTGMFSGQGDIKLASDLVFAMGKNKIVLEKGSGGMTRIENNELARLGGTLKGRFDDAEGPLVRVEASGDFDARTPELVTLEGAATLLRELKLGPDGSPWIIVEKGLTCVVRMAHNKLTYAEGKNGKFRVPALRLTGGFDHITMNAEGPKTKYSGKGFLEMEMLKEDKEKGRKLKGRLDVDYREDDTWNARGTVDYNITPYLGGQITAEMDQTLDPVLGGTLVMQKKEMLPARDLFSMKFPIIPDMTIPVAGIAGFGFGARGHFGLSTLPMMLSASVGVQNFRPRQMNVPDFSADATIDWGLRLKAGAMAYLDARLSVLVASASIGIKGTADLAGDAKVQAKGKIAGAQGKYWGELGVGLKFAPSVTIKAQPFAKASLFNKEWEKSWDAYEYDLGEVFAYEWGSTYKFGDNPEAPKNNGERQPASVAGAPRQSMGRVNTKAEAETFGEERATPAAAATQGRPQLESGEEHKKKKEQKEAGDMKDLEEEGKEAADIGSVMAAVGNIVTQLGHIIGSLAFGPLGLALCLAWKWIKGALNKLYKDWCTVRDYITQNWDKIAEYLPGWFKGFIEFMQNPKSAADKWWNADVYTRDAVNAGEHLKVVAEVRGNMVKNLFSGYVAEGDRRAIEEIFAVSQNKGDLREVIIASGYGVNRYPEAWWRHSDWGGSRLERIYTAAGWNVSPGNLKTTSNVNFDMDEAASRPDPETIHAHAAEGITGGAGPLPFQGEIQAAFGAHDVSGVQAHTDGAAHEANAAMGANAYATGNDVAFGGTPDLHTAAHEAAHVVQQREGVALDGGVGQSGDAYEQHADAVADKVVAGESAEGLLGAKAGESSGAEAVQRSEVVQHDKKESEDDASADNDKAEGKETKPKGATNEKGEESKDKQSLLGELAAEWEKVEAFKKGLERYLRSPPDYTRILKAKANLEAQNRERAKGESGVSGKSHAGTGAKGDKGEQKDSERSGEASAYSPQERAFKDACKEALKILDAAAKDALEDMSRQLTRHEGPLSILQMRVRDATGLSGQAAKDASQLSTRFDELKAAYATDGAAIKAVRATRSGTPPADSPIATRSKMLDEVKPLEKKVKQHLADYDKLVAELMQIAKDRRGFFLFEANLRKQIAAAMRRQRSHGKPSQQLSNMADEDVIELIALVPDLRAAYIGMVKLHVKGHDIAMQVDATDLGPAKGLAERISAAKADKAKGVSLDEARLEEIRAYLRKWGKNETALSEARQSTSLAAAMKPMGAEALALANEMLATGTILVMVKAGEDGKGGGIQKEDEQGKLVDVDPGTALSIIAIASQGSEPRDIPAWLAARIEGLARAVRQAVAIRRTPEGGHAKAFESLINKCGLNQVVLAFLQATSANRAFFKATFKPLMAMDLSGLTKDAQTGSSSDDPTTFSTVIDLCKAIAAKKPSDDIAETWESAKKEKNLGQHGAAAAVKKAYPKYGGALNKALAELLGSPEKILAARQDPEKSALDAKLVTVVSELGLGLGDLLTAVHGAAKQLDVKEKAPHSEQADKVGESLRKEHGVFVEAAKALSSKLDGQTVKAVVGAPPDKRKVDYLLDRFSELTGKDIFHHPCYQQAGYEHRFAFHAAIGHKSTEGGPSYIDDLNALSKDVASMAAVKITEIVKVAKLLDEAMAKAGKVIGALAGERDRPDEALAPNGRLPTTPEQVFLNVYHFCTERDFIAALQTKLNAWYTYAFTGSASDIKASIKGDNDKLAGALKLHFGYDLKHLSDSADTRGVSLEAGEDAKSKTVGDTQIVKPEMKGKVRPEFDDMFAYRIAENVYAVLNADALTAGFLEEHAEESKAGDLAKLAVLAGSQKELIGVLKASERVTQLIIGLKGLTLSERDCVDAAFRLRFGRTLATELAKAGQAKGASNWMKLEADDPHAELKDDLRRALTTGNKDRFQELLLGASAEQKQAILADDELVDTMHASCKGNAAKWHQIHGVLTGQVDLATLIKDRKGLFNDDEPGMDKDVATFTKLLVAELKVKYPAAFDAQHPEHAAYKQRYEAELRSRLLETATDEDVIAAAQTVLTEEELRHLQTMILGSGTESGKESVVETYRKKWFWMRDIKAVVEAIKALGAAERATIKGDPEVRALVIRSLKEEQQRLVFGLLDGDVNAELVASYDGKWWLRLDVEGIFEKIEAMDFDAWSFLRKDHAAVQELAGKLGAKYLARFRGLLKLDYIALPQGMEHEPGHSAEQKNQALRAFHLDMWRAKLLRAANKSVSALLEAACAIYKLEVTAASDTATADALKKDDTDLEQYRTTDNHGAHEDLLSMPPKGGGKSVRERLAADGELLSAFARAFGATSGDQPLQPRAPKTGRLADLQAAILKYRDPAPDLFAYHERGGKLESNGKGMQTSIELADDVTFLAELTNLTFLVPLVRKVEAAREALDAAGPDKKQTMADLKEARLAVRDFRFDFSLKVRRQVEKSADVDAKKSLYEAFRGRLLALLGKDGIAGAANIGIVVQALYLLDPDLKLRKETITEDIGGADLEARVKRDAELEKQLDSTDGLYGKLDTSVVGKMIGGKSQQGYADATGAYIRAGANSEAKNAGKIDEAGLEAMDARQKELAAARAKVEAERKWIADIAANAGSQAVGLLIGSLTGGSGPLVLTIFANVFKALASNGIKQWVYGDKNYDFVKELTLEVIASTVSSSIGSLLDVSGITGDGKLGKGVLKDLPRVRQLIEPYFEQVKTKVTAGLTNPAAWAEAYERGALALFDDLERSIKLEAIPTKMWANFEDSVELFMKELAKQGGKDAGAWLGDKLGVDEERESFTEQLGLAGMDDRVSSVTLAKFDEQTKTLWSKARGAAGAALGESFAKLFEKNTWKKKVVALLTEKISELGTIAKDPKQHLIDWGKSLDAMGVPYQKILDSDRGLKLLTALLASPIGIQALELASETGTKAQEAFWLHLKKLGLVEELLKEGPTTPALERDLTSHDRSRVNLVEGFLRSKDDAQSTLTYSAYMAEVGKQLHEAVKGFTDPADVCAAEKAASEYFAEHGVDFVYDNDDKARTKALVVFKKAVAGAVEKDKKKRTPVQKKAVRTGGGAVGDAHEAATQGVQGGGHALPHREEIQAAFGAHDVSDVVAHTGAAAAEASDALGAHAYATGDHVAFGGAPDLHTAAHEAAHVVQQRRGVSLAGGMGQSGDAYERQADAVADAVVAGDSAEALLGACTEPGSASGVVQRDEKKPGDERNDQPKTEEGEGHEETGNEAPSGPLEVRLEVTESVTETAGVAPLSSTALGQAVPVTAFEIKSHEQKDGILHVKAEHRTNIQWGVDARDRKDASLAVASLELEPKGSERAGMKQFWAMASDIWPLPGINAPPMLEYWSREHVVEHERFHIEDMRKWLSAHAKQVVLEAFTEKEMTASYLVLQLKTAGMRAKNAVDGGLIDHMSAGFDPETDYYQQPGEKRAYAAGAPGLLLFASQILAAGARLMQAAQGAGAPEKAGDEGDKGAEGGTGELRAAGASLVMRKQHGHADDHPERVPGVGEKVSGGDEDKAIWPPDTSFSVDVVEVQDEVLDDKSFGSVRPEWQVRDVTSESDGKKVRIAGKVHVILHWNVQSLGKKDATPALASLEPETAPEYQGKGLKVYEAMVIDLIPDANNFPPQRAYWSREHAEMHERVHLDDYTAWARGSGPAVANDAWMMRSYRPGQLDEDVEAQRVETEKQLMYGAMKDLQGLPPKDYLQQPTEMNAFGTVAPELRTLAESIRDAGDALAAKARQEVAGKETTEQEGTVHEDQTAESIVSGTTPEGDDAKDDRLHNRREDGVPEPSDAKALLGRPELPRLAREPSDGKRSEELLALADNVRDLYTDVQGQLAGGASGAPAHLWNQGHIAVLLEALATQGVRTHSVKAALDAKTSAGMPLEAVWGERVRGLDLLYQAIEARLDELRAEEAKRGWVRPLSNNGGYTGVRAVDQKGGGGVGDDSARDDRDGE